MFSNDGGSEIYLPLGLDSLTIYHHPDSQLWCRGQIAQKESRENIVADLTLINDDGAVVAVLKGLALKRASRQALLRMMQPSFHDWLYRVDWQPQAAPIPAASASGSWLIFSDDAGIAVELALRLSTQGDRYALVSLGQGYQAVDNGYQIDP